MLVFRLGIFIGYFCRLRSHNLVLSLDSLLFNFLCLLFWLSLFLLFDQYLICHKIRFFLYF